MWLQPIQSRGYRCHWPPPCNCSQQNSAKEEAFASPFQAKHSVEAIQANVALKLSPFGGVGQGGGPRLASLFEPRTGDAQGSLIIYHVSFLSIAGQIANIELAIQGDRNEWTPDSADSANLGGKIIGVNVDPNSFRISAVFSTLLAGMLTNRVRSVIGKCRAPDDITG